VSTYNDQFLKHHPLAVLGVLRDLHKARVPIRISWGSQQLISRILDVDASQLVMDFGSQTHENKAVQEANDIQISAETQGAKIEFNLPQLKAGDYQSLPAFVTQLPPSLWFVQRREYFRIPAPLNPIFYCEATLNNGEKFRFRLADLSLGGLGALVDGPVPEGLQEGQLFSQVKIELGEWGTFHFDMQLITISERLTVSNKNETVATPRLSFRFLNINPAVERELQRIIFALERIAREKANKVR